MKGQFFGMRRLRRRQRRHCSGLGQGAGQGGMLQGEAPCGRDGFCSLNDLVPGTHCRVARLKGCGAIRQRLLDLGLVNGAEVTVIRAAPLNDPIAIRVGNAVLTVRRAEAATIEVERD